MAKKAWMTQVQHNTVDAFKAWVSSLSTALDEIGFIKSSDSGQLSIPGITSIPATNAVAGYEIRYLNDSLHATAPIYVKLEYGTADTSGRPALAISVGTGTNGAGTLSGVFGARYAFNPGWPASAGSLNCYACMVNGCVWFDFCSTLFAASSATTSFCLVIARTVDGAGLPTRDGAVAYYPRANWDNFDPGSVNFGSAWQSAAPFTSATARGFGGNGKWCVNAFGATQSNTSDLSKQVIPHIVPFPELKVIPQIFSLLPGDSVAEGSEIEAAIVGLTKRNYIVTRGMRPTSIEHFGLLWE